MREGVFIFYVIIYLYDELSISSDLYLYSHRHIYPHHVSNIYINDIVQFPTCVHFPTVHVLGPLVPSYLELFSFPCH